jgi:hypothetical protein
VITAIVDIASIVRTARLHRSARVFARFFVPHASPGTGFAASALKPIRKEERR